MPGLNTLSLQSRSFSTPKIKHKSEDPNLPLESAVVSSPQKAIAPLTSEKNFLGAPLLKASLRRVFRLFIIESSIKPVHH